MQPRGKLPGNTAHASCSLCGSARALPPSAAAAHRGRGHASWRLCPAGGRLVEREAALGLAAQGRLPEDAGRSKSCGGYFFARADWRALWARKRDTAVAGKLISKIDNFKKLHGSG